MGEGGGLCKNAYREYSLEKIGNIVKFYYIAIFPVRNSTM